MHFRSPTRNSIVCPQITQGGPKALGPVEVLRPRDRLPIEYLMLRAGVSCRPVTATTSATRRPAWLAPRYVRPLYITWAVYSNLPPAPTSRIRPIIAQPSHNSSSPRPLANRLTECPTSGWKRGGRGKRKVNVNVKKKKAEGGKRRGRCKKRPPTQRVLD